MEPLPFSTRIWFAWVAYFKILFDGMFAARCYNPPPALPEPKPEPKVEAKPEPKPEPKVEAKPEPKKPETAVVLAPPTDAALQLLALLQREGRFVDFLEEDVASFSDADIGAAARVVHSGCRKAIREHVKLEPVRDEEEGAKVTVNGGAADQAVKLTGNVQGKGPHTGTLRHRGWKATDVKLPSAIAGHDTHIVAQAEVEL